MLQNVWQDARYGFRGLIAHPGFTLIAILTLALGIGSAAAIFSVIQNVLLDPAPYADVDRIAYVQIRDASRNEPGGRNAFHVPEFLDYQEQSQVFEDVIGGGFEDALITTKEGTLQFAAGLVTPNTFRFLGVAPQLGRGIAESDVAPGAPPVFVMSHKMWVAQHSMDPAVVGRVFVINGVPTTCVGVMPPRFTKQGADLWKPMRLDRADPAQQRRYIVFQAKLKRGISFEHATAEMDLVARRIAKVYPDNYPPRFTVHVISWVDGLVRQFKTTLYKLFAAVGVLLLIACTNVANMLLARAAAREKEMAIRTSLGAGRWLLVRQLLIESLMLALGGAVLGSALAYAGIAGVKGLMPQGLFPTEADIRLNVPVLAFSLGIAVFTAILFGLVPALQTVKKNMAEPLKDSGRGVVGGFRRGKLRSALVIGEVALSLVLLAGAGLLIRNFVKLQSVDLGFNPDNVLVARLPLPREQYKSAAAKQQFFEALLPRLHALPGVVAATETTNLPPYGGIGTDIDIPGKTHSERWEAIYQLCSDGYFRTLGLRVVRGRTLSHTEVSTARKVAVINQTFANKYFPAENPIGRQIVLKGMQKLPDGNAIENPLFEVIGVIADARNDGIVDPILPEVFVPYTVTGAFERGILVRTQGDPDALLAAVRNEIWAVDRGVALTLTGTLTSYLRQFSYAEPRFSLVLLTVFAIVGLILVAVGVYSVIAYTVARQTREIGIRMALGAGRRDVLRMVSVMGLRLIAVGAVIGLLASFGATRFIASQLTGVSPHDPLTLLGVVLVMGLVGLAACFFPAQKASRVDPLVALRTE
ncbi:MAG TPA: ABC transporter permease [Vicinamibacterales bacterium]|nr:ABC transporter permease [Vicinamibacterales bacterium]